jgi:hypothetical protein
MRWQKLVAPSPAKNYAAVQANLTEVIIASLGITTIVHPEVTKNSR